MKIATFNTCGDRFIKIYTLFFTLPEVGDKIVLAFVRQLEYIYLNFGYEGSALL